MSETRQHQLAIISEVAQLRSRITKRGELGELVVKPQWDPEGEPRWRVWGKAAPENMGLRVE